MRKTLLLMTALIFGPPTVHATELPRYALEAYCGSVADVSGGSTMIYSGCANVEQASYNKLKTDWSSIAQKSRNYCDEVARVSGDSYRLLDGYMDMEVRTAASTPAFKI